MSWTVPRKFKPGDRMSGAAYDRVRKLASMFEEVQKKTFTKWVNVQLRDTGLLVEALEYDLRDGKVLLALLYTLARLPTPPTERGTMRIHRLANVGNALQFLERKLGGPLMNVGAEDIVDGNLKLTLGLVWVVILRFQIQRAAKAQVIGNNGTDPSANKDSDSTVITAEPDSIVENNDLSTNDKPSKTENRKRQSKAINQHDVRASLLGWVKSQTINYVNAPEVTDFSRSWQSGCLFMLLIHRYDPAILPSIDEILTRDTPEYWSDTLNEAFTLAQSHLDITPLLEVDDVASMEVPDERSIMIYVSEFYVAMTSRQNQDALARCAAEEERRAEEWRLAQAGKGRAIDETVARRGHEHTLQDKKPEHLQLQEGRERLRTAMLVPESPTDGFMEPSGDIEQQLRRMTVTEDSIDIQSAGIPDMSLLDTSTTINHSSSPINSPRQLPAEKQDDNDDDADEEINTANTQDPNHLHAANLYAETETLYNQLMADCSRALDMLPEPRSTVTFATVADMKQFVERTTEISACLKVINEEKALDTMRQIRGEIGQICVDCELIEDCEMLEESISVLLNRLSEEEELCRQLSSELTGLISITEAVQSIGESLEKSEADLDDMLGVGKSLEAPRIELIKTAVADVIGMLQQTLPDSIPPAVANELLRSRELAGRVTGRLEACDRYFVGDAQLNQMQSRINAVKENMTAISQFVPEALGAVIQEIEGQLDSIDIDLKKLTFSSATDDDAEIDDDFNEDILDMLNIRKIDLTEDLLLARSAFAQAKEDAYRTKRASFAMDECRRYVQNCLAIYREHTAEREKRLALALVDDDNADNDISNESESLSAEHINATIQEIECGFEKLQTMCADGFKGHTNIEKILGEAERARDDVRSAIDLGRNLDTMLGRYREMITFYAGVMHRIDKARSSLPVDGQYTNNNVKEPELMKVGSEIMRITADDCSALCESIDDYSRSDFVMASELAGLDRFRMRVNMNYTQLMAAWNTLKADLEVLRAEDQINQQRLDYSRNISSIASRVNELHEAMLSAVHSEDLMLEQLHDIHNQVKDQAKHLSNLISSISIDVDAASFQEEGNAVLEQLEQLEVLILAKIRDAELIEQFHEEMLDMDGQLNHLLNEVDECIIEAASTTNIDEIENLIHRLSIELTEAETEIPNRLTNVSSLAVSINGRVASEELSKFEKQWRETRSFAANELEALRKKLICKPSLITETLPEIAEETVSTDTSTAPPTSNIPVPDQSQRRASLTGTRHRRRSSSANSNSDKSPVGSRSGFKWVRPMLVHPSPNAYVPDKSDKLDVRVASIINDYGMQIKLERTQAGRYLIGDIEPKAIFCRMLNDRMVMVRVGGGWVELSRFLSTHGALLHKLVPITSDQNESAASPLYPVRLPASTLPTMPTSPGFNATSPTRSSRSGSRSPSFGSIPRSPRRNPRSPSASPRIVPQNARLPDIAPPMAPQVARTTSKGKAPRKSMGRPTTDGTDVLTRMAIRMEQSYNHN